MDHVQDYERLRQRPNPVNIGFLGILLFILASAECLSATHYVVTNGTPGWIGAADPYTNWATAGTNIIDVVNAAMTNTTPRVILVTNGVYYPTNVIDITNYLTLQSVNGRDVTTLAGQGSTFRCVTFSGGTNSVLDGFTVTNFAPSSFGAVYSSTNGVSIINCQFVKNSGGVYINTPGYGGIVTNCVFSNNTHSGNIGGGLLISHGLGVHDERVENCYFYGNSCPSATTASGGGCYICGIDCIISNCVFINNLHRVAGGAIGVAGGSGYTILNCSIISNFTTKLYGPDNGGGGIFSRTAAGTLIKDCSIIGNSSATTGGGVLACSSATIQNCLIARNQTTGTYGTVGGGVYLNNASVKNCTIVSNYANTSGGGAFIDGSGGGTNNIVYFNTAGVSADNFTNTAGNTGLQYSCVIPAVDGTRNITNDPSLVSLDGGNYRLKDNSPCVNAGLNQSWMPNAVDLDRSKRIDGGTVDIGCYEYQYGVPKYYLWAKP